MEVHNAGVYKNLPDSLIPLMLSLVILFRLSVTKSNLQE